LERSKKLRHPDAWMPTGSPVDQSRTRNYSTCGPGFDNKEIPARLNLSDTIKNRLFRIYEKLWINVAGSIIGEIIARRSDEQDPALALAGRAWTLLPATTAGEESISRRRWLRDWAVLTFEAEYLQAGMS
jgi:hypothetical protein